jgi:phenylacetic acid degradation operon negative regulatory protein
VPVDHHHRGGAEDLGVSPDAARALLSRICRQGQLSSEREGRTTRYRLAGEFARSFERVRDQSMARPAQWTGRFHALLYQVPE